LFFPSVLKRRTIDHIKFEQVCKKLDLLLKHAGIDVDPVADALQRGDANLGSRRFITIANPWKLLREQPARYIGIACLVAWVVLLSHADKFIPWPWGFFAFGALFGFGACFVGQSNPQSQYSRFAQVDAKLDQLLKQPGVKFDPNEDLLHDVRDAMQRGDKIQAILRYREATGCSLSEALAFLAPIEEAQRQMTR
jgi:hypothetical protein